MFQQQGNSSPLHVDLRFEAPSHYFSCITEVAPATQAGETGTLWLHVRLHFSDPLIRAGLPMVVTYRREAGCAEEVSGIVSDVERVFRQRFSGTILEVLNPRLEDCMRIDHYILQCYYTHDIY